MLDGGQCTFPSELSCLQKVKLARRPENNTKIPVKKPALLDVLDAVVKDPTYWQFLKKGKIWEFF